MKKSNTGSNSKKYEPKKFKIDKPKAMRQPQNLHEAKKEKKVELQRQVSLHEAFLEMDKNKGKYFRYLILLKLGVKLVFNSIKSLCPRFRF